MGGMSQSTERIGAARAAVIEALWRQAAAAGFFAPDGEGVPAERP